MKPKILIADGSPENLEKMKLKLESWGFDVYLAADENTFCSLVFLCKPDLIILDIMLGERNTAHIYDELVSKRGLDRKIPVIFLTDLLDGHPESFAYPGRTYSLHQKTLPAEDLKREIEYLVESRPET